ncbi:doublesex- and mab-3-related transcription factor B1 [Eptesicus fuscus]|uniref:doublesex- and mab-3-related transcription factor B1 n=1 Tax=Eptesicus fuscus TaxID=29078 RepID=UPI002403A875|nr:doublesex- and mab-3-related transcription factor B1 [Eptesicus fuscus]
MLRTPNCSRCRNHGYLVAVKGHAGKCRWKQCNCEKCYLITERQKIMAAQKMLKKQASEEDRELASRAAAIAPASSLRPLPPLTAPGDLEPGPEGRAAAYLLERPPRGPSPGPSAFQPVLGGRGHVGPSDPAAVARPSFVRPQLGAEAAGQGGSGPLEPSRPLQPMPRPPPPPPPPFAFGLSLSINSDAMVQSEYLEREPSKLYPSCSGMYSYRPFPMGYQDPSPGLGISLQQGFRHVSFSHYHGGGSVPEPVENFQPSYPPLPPPLPPPRPLLPPPSPLLPPPLLPPPLSPPPPFLPPGFLAGIHFLPPPPPPPPPASFSLTVLSDGDQEAVEDQVEGVPREPSQPSSQEQSD